MKSPIDGLAISNGLRPGLAMVAKDLADELGPRGVRVNGLMPGRIETERVRWLDEQTGDADGRQGRGRPRRSRCAATVGPRSSAGPRRSCSHRLRASSAARCSRSTAAWSAPREPAPGSSGPAGCGGRTQLAALVVGEVAEPEHREHAEEPPLQAVEEVRAVAEVGLLGRHQGGRRAQASPSAASTKPPYTGPSSRLAISLLEIARAEPSATAAALPVASTRDPADDGHLPGRRCRRGDVVRADVAGLHPAAVHEQHRPPVGAQRRRRVDSRGRRRGSGSGSPRTRPAGRCRWR